MLAFVIFFALLSLSAALPYQYARQQYLQCKFLYDLGGIGTIVFCVDDPDDTCVILRMSLPNNSLVRNVGTSCLDSTQGLAHAARDGEFM